MDVIKKRIDLDSQPGKLLTTLKRGEVLRMNGPAEIELLSTAHDGHKDQIRISVTAPKSTKIEKNK